MNKHGGGFIFEGWNFTVSLTCRSESNFQWLTNYKLRGRHRLRYDFKRSERVTCSYVERVAGNFLSFLEAKENVDYMEVTLISDKGNDVQHYERVPKNTFFLSLWKFLPTKLDAISNVRWYGNHNRESLKPSYIGLLLLEPNHRNLTLQTASRSAFTLV